MFGEVVEGWRLFHGRYDARSKALSSGEETGDMMAMLNMEWFMDKRIDIYVTRKIDVQKQEKLEKYLFMNIVHYTVDP